LLFIQARNSDFQYQGITTFYSRISENTNDLEAQTSEENHSLRSVVGRDWTGSELQQLQYSL